MEDENMENYNQFKKGQKVKDFYGNTYKVLGQVDCQVWVNKPNTWFHPSKLYSI